MVLNARHKLSVYDVGVIMRIAIDETEQRGLCILPKPHRE